MKRNTDHQIKTQKSNDEIGNIKMQTMAIGMASILGATAIGIGARFVFGGSSKNQTVTAESNNSNLGNTVSTSKSGVTNDKSEVKIEGENINKIHVFNIHLDDIENIRKGRYPGMNSTDQADTYKNVPLITLHNATANIVIPSELQNMKIDMDSKWLKGDDGNSYLTNSNRINVYSDYMQKMGALIDSGLPITYKLTKTYNNADYQIKQFDLQDGSNIDLEVGSRMINGKKTYEYLQVVQKINNLNKTLRVEKLNDNTLMVKADNKSVDIRSGKIEYLELGDDKYKEEARFSELLKIDEDFFRLSDYMMNNLYTKQSGIFNTTFTVKGLDNTVSSRMVKLDNVQLPDETNYVNNLPKRTRELKLPKYMNFSLAPNPDWGGTFGERNVLRYFYSEERTQMYFTLLQKLGRLLDDNRDWIGPTTKYDNHGMITEKSKVLIFDHLRSHVSEDRLNAEVVLVYSQDGNQKKFFGIGVEPLVVKESSKEFEDSYSLYIKPDGEVKWDIYKKSTNSVSENGYAEVLEIPEIKYSDVAREYSVDSIIALDNGAMKEIYNGIIQFLTPNLQANNSATTNEVQFGGIAVSSDTVVEPLTR